MRLLAVDPGKHLIGAAIFQKGPNDREWWLAWCGVVEFESLFELSGAFQGSFTHVICEVPQVYPGPRKEDPNDLIDITLSAGIILSLNSHSVAVRPHEWKGSVPKDVHHKRVLATAEEKAVRAFSDVKKSIRHNVIDAYALGKWYLGRLKGGH